MRTETDGTERDEAAPAQRGVREALAEFRSDTADLVQSTCWRIGA